MQRTEGKVFKGASVHVDENIFVTCTFTDCDLQFWGGDFVFQDCKFTNCRFTLNGAAWRTLIFINSMGALKDGVFKQAPQPTTPASGTVN